ncbi:hypothetical protein [Phage f2b1]|nr:hypothetical protein [Phage f2b1]
MKITERDASYDPNVHLLPGILAEVEQEFAGELVSEDSINQMYIAINKRVNALIATKEFRTSYIDIDGRELQFIHIIVRPLPSLTDDGRVAIDVAPVWAYTSGGVYDDEE